MEVIKGGPMEFKETSIKKGLFCQYLSSDNQSEPQEVIKPTSSLRTADTVA